MRQLNNETCDLDFPINSQKVIHPSKILSNKTEPNNFKVFRNDFDNDFDKAW